MDLQWKRDMRQGVVTCLCEVEGNGGGGVVVSTPSRA